MSWRTRAGFESINVPVPAHRSRQVVAADIDRATVVITLAPEHVEWVRREHPAAADKTATLKRVGPEGSPDDDPSAEPTASPTSRWPTSSSVPWEEVVDPGGGEVEAFTACAREVVDLVEDVAARLRPPPR